MLTQEQLAAYFEGQLQPRERAEIEQLLENDSRAQLVLADQKNLDLALRVLLGKTESHERVKQSIFTVLRGASSEELTSAVMKETGAVSAPPQRKLAGLPRYGRSSSRPSASQSTSWLAKAESFFGGRLPFWAPACAVALLVCGLLLLFLPTSRERFAVGQFAAVVGEPTLQHGAKRSAAKPQIKTSVFLGDRIETGDADKAELVFKDGTTLRLAFNTVIEITQPSASTAKAKSSILRPGQINLLRGQIWTKVQKLTNAPQYAIRTEAATAVARGTEFGVKIQRPASTNASAPLTVLTVKEGAVHFSNSLGSVQATAMTESTASVDAAPSQPVVLQILKTFDLAPGKQVNVVGMHSAFDLDAWMYRMAYPQGWAGFSVRAIPGSGDDTVRRLQIVRVWPGSPAERAGLAVGDVITRVDGQPVTEVHEVLRPVFRRQGSAVTLEVWRGEKAQTASFVTTKHPYALPYEKIARNLAADGLDATWALIEAGSQERVSSNQWRQLTREFQTVLARHPNHAALHHNLALWYILKDETGSAVEHLKQAVTAETANPLYHYTLSWVLASIGNFERSLEEAEEAVKLAPAWVPGLLEVARACYLLDRYDDALDVIEAGVRANPDHPQLWEKKALVLLTGRRPREALDAALKAVVLEPSNAQWQCLLNIIHEALGNSAEAQAASRKAIELDPGLANAHHSLAIDIIRGFPNRLPEDVTDAPPEEMALERWRERPAHELAIIAEAERYARRAIELRADYAGYYVDLGNILLTRGDLEEAEKILRTAMEMDPGGQAAAHARNGLAYRFAIWGIRLDEALELAQQAARTYPAGYILDTLAVVHFRRGEWDHAEAAWKKCIELSGPAGDPGAWFHLGKVYERKNQTAAAIAAYQEAIRLRPEFPEASRALAKLQK